MTFEDALASGAALTNLDLSARQYKAFADYADCLLAWNEKVNLTAITQPEEVAIKHMLDSLAGYDAAFFPPGCSVIDVGTGAGFPGLPLKIYRPDITLTLLDSLNKRLNFLQDVVDRLALREVTLVHARAEDAGRETQHRERYKVAVSRAVARLNVLVELCLPYVVSGGYFIAWKGDSGQEELAEAGRAIKLLGGEVVAVKTAELPFLGDKRTVICIKKVAATPREYPRRAGLPKKKPL